MKILKAVGELVSPNDPVLVEKTLIRLAEQDTWNDVFSTKLIELLDSSDQLKGEIRERMRKADERIAQAELVTQAETLLRETATRFGEASQRLEQAVAAERRTLAAADEARQQWVSATNDLKSARRMADAASDAAADANRMMRSAQQAHGKAERLFHLTTRYAAVSAALSWTAMAWTGWFIARTNVFLSAAMALSIGFIILTAWSLRGIAQ